MTVLVLLNLPMPLPSNASPFTIICMQLRYAAVANTVSGPHRGKRQTGSEFRPIRIVPFYDNTVEVEVL